MSRSVATGSLDARLRCALSAGTGFAPMRVGCNDGREMTSEAAGIRAKTLSVVVPTYREAANVPVLFERLRTALIGNAWEMIVVDDDSPDGTPHIAFSL